MIRFSKMHGAGNDFVVIDAIGQAIDVEQVDWRQVADRHFGVGADQVLVVERPQDPSNDFRYRIFNADGAEVEQCGNALRCVGWLLLLIAGCARSDGTPELVWGQRGVSGGQLVKPRAIAIDAQDHLYIVDWTARIQAFDGEQRFFDREWRESFPRDHV